MLTLRETRSGGNNRQRIASVMIVAFCCGLGVLAAWIFRVPSIGLRGVSSASQGLTGTLPRDQGGQPSIPKLRTGVTWDTPQLVPGQAGYDPTRFVGVVKPSDVFDQEPRDDKWATAVETRLSAMVQQEVAGIVPDAGRVKIECRTSMCKFTWEGPQGESVSSPASYNGRMSEVIHVLYGGVGGGIRAGNNPAVWAIYAGSELANLPRDDIDGLFRGIQEHRKKRLQTMWTFHERTGRRVFPEGIDMNSVPKE
jgi:hypothetical protein